MNMKQALSSCLVAVLLTGCGDGLSLRKKNGNKAKPSSESPEDPRLATSEAQLNETNDAVEAAEKRLAEANAALATAKSERDKAVLERDRAKAQSELMLTPAPSLSPSQTATAQKVGALTPDGLADSDMAVVELKEIDLLAAKILSSDSAKPEKSTIQSLITKLESRLKAANSKQDRQIVEPTFTNLQKLLEQNL